MCPIRAAKAIEGNTEVTYYLGGTHSIVVLWLFRDLPRKDKPEALAMIYVDQTLKRSRTAVTK